ncbi:sigma factor regulator VreR [Aliidongia dinghuensis]|uniref:Sigma factor regulator VreR n=1 Tax=Aliidongia dinghuensis TaxID=1867774 RepID=A0A8J2YT93_9PROT|nr:FecR domain-containing protein [Aliidongia dinghuensis]GGF18428.1 sigma factor regulator VreR [Aliidongia dinghuensis]
MIEADDRREEMLQREALAWVTRIGLGNATKDELATLRRWRDTSPAHAAALARAGRLWRELGSPVEALARVGTATAPARARRPSRRAVLGGAVTVGAAASAAVLMLRPPFGLWPSLAELEADYRTGTGERRRLALSDAVSIEMNTQTSVTVHPAADGAGVELISGEAAVTVIPSAVGPFVVSAAGGRMRATQATFNVRRTGAAVCVTCIDGEVAVEQGDQTLRVGPARQVSYGGERLGEIATADPAAVVAWREGMLVFHDTPLAEVIDEVNRYRPGRIVLLDAALGRRLVTARFELARLDTVMGQIRHVFGASIRTLPGGLVLVG